MRNTNLLNARKEYASIILNAKSQNRNKKDGNYYEAHHILPRSLFPLWSKRKSNIVLLTAREHFRCHQLLAEIFPGKEMNYALVAFCIRPNADYKIQIDEYERIKKLNAELMRQKMLGKKKKLESVLKSADARRGVKRTDEARKRMSDAQKEFLKKNPDFMNLPKMYWFTDGKINLHLKEGEIPPKGFYKGRYMPWVKSKHND